MVLTEKNQASLKSSNRNWVELAASLIGFEPELIRSQESKAKNLLRRSLSLLRHGTLNLYMLEGESASSGRWLKLAVADDGRTLPYIRQVADISNIRQSHIGRVPALQACRLAVDCDVLVVAANRLLSGAFVRNGFQIIPAWVRLFVDLSLPPDELLQRLGSSVKEDVRKVRTRGFTYEVTDDSRWLNEFYDNMYLPYAKSRYGDLAIIHSRKCIEKLLKHKCLLLIIKRDDVPAISLMMLPDGELLKCLYMGVAENGLESVKQGGSAAFYWYAYQWAYSQGFKALSFGHSRAFLSDGVLRYKLKWGMHVVEDDDAVCDYAIRATPGSEAGEEFMSVNPFFHLCDGRLAVYSPEMHG